jgi:hypothetical protein
MMTNVCNFNRLMITIGIAKSIADRYSGHKW